MATNAAINVYAPTAEAGGTRAVTSSTTSCTYASVSGSVRVWVKSTVDTQIRFSSSSADSACTAGDIYLTAGQDYVFDRKTPGDGVDGGFRAK